MTTLNETAKSLLFLAFIGLAAQYTAEVGASSGRSGCSFLVKREDKQLNLVNKL